MEQFNLKQIGERLADLRDILGYTPEEMASVTDTTVEFYLSCEAGMSDIPISFLHKAATHLNVDITDLITGEAPRLSMYHVVKSGEGIPVERRSGFAYQNMSYLFRDRKVEPFVVVAPYSDEAESSPIQLSVHDGHEFDMILSGKLKMVVGENTEILEAGDCIYLNSRYPHGMIATGGEDCKFLAVVIPEGQKK